MERIGFKDKKGEVSLPQEQEQADYPKTPAYKMKFEEMLRRARYDDDVLEQYKHALDIEVCEELKKVYGVMCEVFGKGTNNLADAQVTLDKIRKKR